MPASEPQFLIWRMGARTPSPIRSGEFKAQGVVILIGGGLSEASQPRPSHLRTVLSVHLNNGHWPLLEYSQQ